MIKQFYLINKWDYNNYHHSDQSGSGNNGNEEVLPIPQSSETGSLLTHDLVSYQDTRLVGGLTPLQKYSQHILQFQLIGLPAYEYQKDLGKQSILSYTFWILLLNNKNDCNIFVCAILLKHS